MKRNKIQIQFMQKCIQYKDIVKSWGISHIQVSDNKLSFYVSGYNYQGMILIHPIDYDNRIIIQSDNGYIGTVNSPILAVQLLDKYIEANEDRYRSLLNFLIK